MSPQTSQIDERYLRQAIELARDNIHRGGRPFGAVVVRDGEVIATAVNDFHHSDDITDHAELLAIRKAARARGSQTVKGSTVYASGHPCPMCMAAMRVAGVARVLYAYSNDDGAPFNFTTNALYEELRRPFAEQSMDIRYVPVRDEQGPGLYEEWARAQDTPPS